MGNPSAAASATATHSRARGRFSLRLAIAWVLLALAYVIGLTYYKGAMLQDLAQRGSELLKIRHPKVLGLFQASFYFFYEDQFVPGIKQALLPAPDGPSLNRIVILSSMGSVLYDTSAQGAARPATGSEGGPVFPDSEVVRRLSLSEPSILLRRFDVQILIPSGQTAILYAFDGSAVRNQLAVALVVALALLFAVWRFLSRERFLRAAYALREGWGKIWRLRVKFLITIILINLLTAVIVFTTLTSLQTREQTERIEKESVLFAQFSTARVISDFTNFYYFYYFDRFLPEIKNTIASNENLVSIRIISRRTNNVLFDSEQAQLGPSDPRGSAAPASATTGGEGKLNEAIKAEFSPETEEQLKARDQATRPVTRDGQKLLSVVSTYRNENQEALFWVEYLFSFNSLAKSIRAIREQILIDLVPSLAISLLIAVVFAQLLISPIRRLVAALGQVTSGDFDVKVELAAKDEIGDLVGAFNKMAEELRKKKELRKYLSDSTYRQVMNAMESPEGTKLGGSRVSATVLFSDIRDFVAHCESLDAEEVTAMLNEYFSEMVEVVYKHGGEVDKFIGDALLAVFYASEESRTIRPVDSDPSRTSAATALQAVYCAMEMRERLGEFNQKRRNAGKRTIEIGVGITHGEIISGPIGAKDRMDFTVIGDVVNLANRIEKLSKTGKYTKIVFSNHVEEKIRGLLEYALHSQEKVRGKQEDVLVYELVGIRDIQSLVANLKSQDLDLRRRSVELLGQSRNAESLQFVIPMLKDADELVRLYAIQAVAKLASRDDSVAVSAILGALRTERSEKVLASAIIGFGKICGSGRIFELEPFLESPNERIVANAIEALGQVRDPRAKDVILPKLTSRNNRIKANAAMALFAAGHIEVIDTLKPMLMHSDHLMRSSAAFAIGELTLIADYGTLVQSWKSDERTTKVFLAELQECVPMLVALLKDPEPIVRRQAVIALGKIKDKSAVLPIIDMVDLEKNPKEMSREILEALRSIGSHKVVREVISKLS